MSLRAWFDVREHEEYGNLGLAMQGRPWADPLGGLAAIHDMLEHMPHDKGDTEGEIMALGASLHVREHYGAVIRSGLFDPVDSIASEFRFQCEYRARDRVTGPLRDPGRTERLFDDERESCVQAIAHRCKRLCLDEGVDREDAAWIEPGKVIGWLRRGYRRAQRRFRGIASWQLSQVFHEAEQGFEDCLKGAEAGYRVRAEIDVRRHNLQIDLLAPWEEWRDGMVVEIAEQY